MFVVKSVNEIYALIDRAEADELPIKVDITALDSSQRALLSDECLEIGFVNEDGSIITVDFAPIY